MCSLGCSINKLFSSIFQLYIVLNYVVYKNIVYTRHLYEFICDQTQTLSFFSTLKCQIIGHVARGNLKKITFLNVF